MSFHSKDKVPGTPTTLITELSCYWEAWEIVGKWVPSPNHRDQETARWCCQRRHSFPASPHALQNVANHPKTKEKSLDLGYDCNAIATAAPRSPPLRRPSRCTQGARKYTRMVTSPNRCLADRETFCHCCTEALARPPAMAAAANIPLLRTSYSSGLPRHYSSLILTAKCRRCMSFSTHQNCPIAVTSNLKQADKEGQASQKQDFEDQRVHRLVFQPHRLM